jgi:hypothetical protein
MASNNEQDQNIMLQLFQLYKEGKLPNFNPNDPNMAAGNNMPANPNMMNPNMGMGGGMNSNMGMAGGMNPNMGMGGVMNPNMGMAGGMNPNMFNPNMGMNQFFNPMMWNNMPIGGFVNNNVVPNPINPNPQPANQAQGQNWTLNFKRKYDNQNIVIQINSEDTVSSAFNRYRIKSLEENVSLKFTLKGKQLDGNLTLSASGLTDGAVIDVEKIGMVNIPQPAPPGFWNLVFERKGDNKASVSIQVESTKKVKDAVNSYKNKVQINTKMIFIFNSKTLQEDMTLTAAGLHDGSKILVITTGDIEGA